MFAAEHQLCEVHLLARLLVPLRDFLFLASQGMVLIKVWRMKRSKVEQHNSNSAHGIFCVKEIMAVYIQTFLNLWYFVLQTIALTGFHARIVDICSIQFVKRDCCHELTHADICQCVTKSSNMPGFLTPNHRNLIKRFSSFSMNMFLGIKKSWALLRSPLKACFPSSLWKAVRRTKCDGKFNPTGRLLPCLLRKIHPT